ncbi:MAG TPA: protein kinase [Candidatus Sulfotelmatobacter sp.]|nr:protein kinase [Candidatus Sulfotelmatobacter sp.]
MIGKQLSHYRIVEQIGAGGMGVVYRAHDEQLDRDVAIKVLPKRSLDDEAARKRFRKEALSLARLNHPNIATVHEFGTQDGTEFLVTEYIPGITLDVKIAKRALPVPEVLRLGVQLASGLAAAHQQGIVHRDLKPGNLRVTADGRLKILDFGLAELMPHASELGMTMTLTQSQDTSGTLPYMSPEQLSGKKADARTDIWAAGAVLYEMATGRRPFDQSVPALLINDILNQVPERPSRLNPEIPAWLDGVILKALSRDPLLRYQSAAELGEELERSAGLSSTSVPVAPQGAFPGWIFVTGALLIALSAGAFFFLRRHQAPTAAPKVNQRRSVAVLGFRNLSENQEKSWLSTAISEMLTTELSQGDQLRTIPGETVAQMKAGLALPDAESFSLQTLSRIRQNLGSDDVVMGSYVPLGNGLLRLDVRLQDAVGGEMLASISEKGTENEIDDLVSRAGAELRSKLGVAALSEGQTALVRASLPANPEAARLYSQGLEKLRLFDAQSARNLLEKAVALDPQHAPTHSALAEAWSVLGYEAKAKDQAKQALGLSAKFSKEEQLLIEGRAHELLAEQAEAIASYRELWEFFPDNVDYGLFLIRAQIAGGHASDAEQTLSALQKLKASEADTARIDLADANIATSLSDFKRQQAAAERAANRSRAVGANLILAQALQLDAHAWERMGDSRKTVELLNQANELYVAAGDRKGAARATLIVGDLLSDQGNYEAARKKYEQALEVFRAIGAMKSMAATVERIGNVFYAEGDMVDARKYYEQALPYDKEINDPYALAGSYGNIANALDGLGDLQGALKMQLESLAAFNQVGDRRGASATLNNLGNLQVEMGNLEEAKKYFDQSLTMAREISYRRGEPYPLSGLGDVHLARGELAEAQKQYDEAMALCKEMDDQEFMAQLSVAEGTIALFENRYSEGENLARQGAAAYEKTNSPGNGAWAESVLARNLLAQGKLTEAQAAVSKAAALVRQSSLQTPRYEVTLADAPIKAKSGKTGEALKALEGTLNSAHKFGYRLYEYQVRLSIAAIEQGAGSTATNAHLSSLAKDAQEHGALLVANQAQALAAAGPDKKQ